MPNKVLTPILGTPLLGYHLQRLSRSKRIDKIVVATTTMPEDGQIETFCNEVMNITCVRGDEADVLGRFEQAARFAGAADADHIVRTTADCPLIDPDLVDEALDHYLSRQPDLDYLLLGPDHYPRGLDAELFKRSALGLAAEKATSAYDREHVTPYIYQHADVFRIDTYRAHGSLPTYRWCVDEAADLALVTRMIEALHEKRSDFSWHDCMELMTAQPELAAINAQVRQKTDAPPQP